MALVLKSGEATFLYLANFLFFALLVRATFYDYSNMKEMIDGPTFTIERFDDLKYAYYSLFVVSTGEGWPNLLFPYLSSEKFLGCAILMVFFVFTSIIIVSVLTGVFATHFDNFYNKMTEEVVAIDQGYKAVIMHCMEAPILKPDDVNTAFDVYHSKGLQGLHPGLHEQIDEESKYFFI
jgi:hypothetical protein